ncbi:MAG: hypothetical protein K9K66_04265 [Desulfarculaceae bacterium]|nr:hypothetical protein [Desulfarculaceae bacterium]MCF8073257.1 hypothetical protein [Desulfarculaceae bacterium]MCF8100853.1 hypothetical protein [Desulfarculaceae bacterium]
MKRWLPAWADRSIFIILVLFAAMESWRFFIFLRIYLQNGIFPSRAQGEGVALITALVLLVAYTTARHFFSRNNNKAA